MKLAGTTINILFILGGVWFVNWVHGKIVQGVDTMGRRDSPPEIYLALGYFIVAIFLFFLVRDIAYKLINKKTIWRSDIWDLMLGPVKDEHNK
jgi:hypothetical protein